MVSFSIKNSSRPATTNARPSGPRRSTSKRLLLPTYVSSVCDVVWGTGDAMTCRAYIHNKRTKPRYGYSPG